VLFFFFLDEKETKNQGCIKRAKIYFIPLQGKSYNQGIINTDERRLMEIALEQSLPFSLLNAAFYKFFNALFLKAVGKPLFTRHNKLVISILTVLQSKTNRHETRCCSHSSTTA